MILTHFLLGILHIRIYYPIDVFFGIFCVVIGVVREIDQFGDRTVFEREPTRVHNCQYYGVTFCVG